MNSPKSKIVVEVVVSVKARPEQAPDDYSVAVARRQGRPDLGMVFEDTETFERWGVVTMVLTGGPPVPGQSSMIVRALTPGAEPRRSAVWITVTPAATSSE
jgi:hypothetical protein